MICEFCRQKKTGGHYNVSTMRWDEEGGGTAWDCLRGMFPKGEANDLNFALFSTSGVHGMYTTIEEIEEGLTKYGYSPEFLQDREGGEDDPEVPDDWHGTNLTVLVVHPRLCSLRYGTVEVTLEDVPYLKNLRQSSWDIMQKIGRDNS